jgi:hypothetical protein
VKCAGKQRIFQNCPQKVALLSEFEKLVFFMVLGRQGKKTKNPFFLVFWVFCSKFNFKHITLVGFWAEKSLLFV